MIQIPFAKVRDERIVLTQQAKQFLNSEEQIAIILVIGEDKSGKTSLIKRIVEQNTQQQQTHELIMYRLKDKSDNPSNLDCQVVILEINNLGNLKVTSYQNLVIFSMFLSSVLLFNSKGNISEQNIHNLSSVISDIQSLIIQTPEQYNIYPTLFWILRDFNTSQCFELPKQYMQKSLQLQKGVSQQTQSINRPKRNIKTYFKDRQCFMLNHPDVKCQYSSFQRQVQVLKQKLLMRIKPLKICNRNMTKKIVLELCVELSQRINNFSKINLKNIHEYIRNRYNKNVFKNNIQNLHKQLNNKRNQRLTSIQIKEFKRVVFKETVSSFQNEIMGDVLQSEVFHNQLVQELEQILQNFSLQNSILWNLYYQQQYNNLSLQYLTNITTLNQISIRLNMTRQQFIKTTQQNSSRQQILSKLQNSWLRSNYLLIANNMIEQQKLHAQQRYNELHSYNSKYQQYCQKVKQDLQKKVNDLTSQKKTLEQKIEQLQFKIYNFQSTNDDFQNTILEKNTLIQTNNKKIGQLLQQIQQKQCQSNLLSEINASNNEELLKLNQQIQRLQVCIHKQQSELKTSILEKQKIELKLKQFEQVVEQLIKDKKKLNESLQKQIIKCQKVTTQLIKLKQEIRKQQTLIKQQQIERKHNEQIKATDTKHLQLKIIELKHHIEEQEDINLRTIQSLKNNLQNEILKKDEVIGINQRLTQSIKSYESKNRKLLQNIDTLKSQIQQYKAYKIQNSLLSSNLCIQPVTTKSKHQSKQKQNRNPKSKNEQSFNRISIKKTLIREQNNKPFTVYEIQVCHNGLTWIIYKKYKQLCQLHSTLKSTFNCTLSTASFIVSPQQLPTKKPLNSQQRKKHLQKYLNDISKLLDIRESKIYASFIQKPKSMKQQDDISFRGSKKFL